MTPHRQRRPAPEIAESPVTGMLEQADVSLLELVDHVLNQGVVLSGDVILGVADVDLIYVRLLALICSADRVLSPGLARAASPKRRRRR